MQKIQFYAGEDKHIRFMVHALNNEAFIIREAGFSLSCAGSIEASGTCVIEDHVIDAKIAPEKTGNYQLSISYKVADETLIEKIEVVVV